MFYEILFSAIGKSSFANYSYFGLSVVTLMIGTVGIPSFLVAWCVLAPLFIYSRAREVASHGSVCFTLSGVFFVFRVLTFNEKTQKQCP